MKVREGLERLLRGANLVLQVAIWRALRPEPAAGQSQRPPCTLTRRMAGLTRTWACTTAIAALAQVSNPIVAAALAASTTVSPTFGYPGATLVATYSFTPKNSCSA